MKTIALLGVAYAAFAAQAALVPRLPWGGFAPDLLLVAACCAFAANAGWRGTAWAAGIGLLGDCLAAGPLGLRMFAATLVATAIAAWRERAPRQSEKWLLAAALPCLFAVLFSATAVRAWLEAGRFEGRGAVEFAAGRAGGSFATLCALVACRAMLRRALPFLGAGRAAGHAGERFSFH